MFTIYPQLLCGRKSLHFDSDTRGGAAEGGRAHGLRLDLRDWAGHLDWSPPPQQRQHIVVILNTCFNSILLLLLAKTFHIN